MTLETETIHVGDCRELLRQMDADSVDCVVTSPPYWGLRAYHTTPQIWGGDPACAHDWGGAPRAPRSQRGPASAETSTISHPQDQDPLAAPEDTGSVCAICGAWRGELGLEPTPMLFVDHMVEVFREVRRVLKPEGTLWLNLGDCYATGAGRFGEHPGGGVQGLQWSGRGTRGYRGDRLANGRGDHPAVLRHKTRATRDGTHAGKHTGIAAMGPMTQPNRLPVPGLKPKDLVGAPWRVAFALQADGWWLRSDIIWAKPNPMPESVLDRPTKAHEYLFLLSKAEHYYYDAAAIRERQTAPEASTPEDAARAFTRRREDVPEPRQGPALPAGVRTTSGNKERKHRVDHGGPADSTKRQAHSIPWDATDGMRNKRSVWTVATQPYDGAHFATFPRKLVEPCVLAGCPPGGVVLDPFGGSGTVGEVAAVLGRRWILIDLNPEYVKLARVRTAQQGLLVRGYAAPK